MRAPRRGSDAPLLPVLRPWNWDLANVCSHRSLVPPRRGPGIPLVGVARDTGRGLDFVRRDALIPMEMSPTELETFALDNLTEARVTWTPLHHNEGTGRPVLLGCEVDGIHSASRILDQDLLLRAHEVLGSRIVLASMPSLRALFVTDGSPMADPGLMLAFVEWTRRHHAAAEGIDALDTTAFVVREGRVVALYDPPRRG